MFKVSIGSKEIPIQDRYTVIKGRFKKDMVKYLKNEVFSEILENIDLIPLKKFSEIYEKRLDTSYNLEKGIDLVTLLNKFHDLMKKNIEFVSEYSEILQSMLLILKFNSLLKKKENLLREFEITDKFTKISDIAAISDLLNKLNKSINDNKKKLQYLEEDYLQRKNQIDQINNTIKNYELKVKNLTKQKKEFFNQINKITRAMSGSPIKEKEESNLFPEIDNSLTNAQKIKAFQTKAKEVQSEINELNLKIDETKLKYNEFNPLYETYKRDYDKLKNIIKTDEQRVEELQVEFKENIMETKNGSHKNFNGIDLKSVRSKQDIEDDIKKADDQLKIISIPRELYDIQNPEDLSKIKKKLNQIIDNLKTHPTKFKIEKDEEQIREIYESFQRLETKVDELESLINKFLHEINLKSNFRFHLSNDNKNLFIKIEFIRNNREKITFSELTTPEKIFFIITYYISIELQVKNNNVMFSNLFIPRIYNKAGSIFRTIRKILPLFENEKNLSTFNLIFILSNLEMKKEIKNLKIITIQENG
ncbi:MAG: coiled-coil domain-containing protein [Candidatus Hodarchaeota archaeon]